MALSPNNTHQLFTSRVKVPASQYIGDPGRIFYHEDTGELRISDGITLGGLPVITGGSGSSNAALLTGTTLSANIIHSSLQTIGTLTNLNVTGNVTATAYYGDGSHLTGTLVGAADAGALTGTTIAPNVLYSSLVSVGTLANLTVTAAIVGSITGNAAYATNAGHATTADSAINATDAITANTVTNAIQSNITSVGTLSSLTVSGNVSANHFIGDGSLLTGIAGFAAANSLTGTTLSPNVLYSSLTTVGTLSNLAVGTGAFVHEINAVTQSSGNFVSLGDAQTSTYVLRQVTGDNIWTEMFLDGASNRINLLSNSSVSFTVTIMARRTDTGTEGAVYEIRGGIDKGAANASTRIIGTISKTVIAEDDSLWDVNAIADVVNGSLKILVLGATGKIIRWVAYTRTVEVSN